MNTRKSAVGSKDPLGHQPKPKNSPAAL